MIEEAQDMIYALSTAHGRVLAARQSGLYELKDDNWQSCYDSLELNEPLATMSIALSPDYDNDQTIFVGGIGGLMRSDDGGATWEGFQFPEPPSIVTAIVFSPDFAQDQTITLATMDDGIYYTHNAGVTWRASNIGLYDRHVMCLAGAQTLYAGTDTGVYRSTNQGQSWNALPFPTLPTTVLSLVVLPDGSILVGTEEDGLYRSTDSGQSWTRVASDLLDDAINALVATESGVLALCDDRLFLSKDGESWQATNDDSGIAAVAVDADGRLVLGLADGTISLRKR